MTNKNSILRKSCVALALLFLFLGIQEGQHQLIMEKAIRICLECIGIG